MRKLQPIALATSLVLSLAIAPSAQAKTAITKPTAPTIASVASSVAKKGKVNVTVTISLPTSDGGSKITGSKVTAGGKSCTMKKLKTSCTIKGLKSGKTLSVKASSKNKKGFGVKSAPVGYVAGASSYANATIGCTIVGTEGNDSLVGTSGDDVICALGGDDVIYGMGGNDTIYGGGGNDTIYGDGGSPSGFLPSFFIRNLDAVTNPGNDTMDGGPGVDTLYGGPGVNPCKGNGTSWDAGDSLDLNTCEDVTAPRIVAISNSPSSINTSPASQSITYTIRLEDDLSGWPLVGQPMGKSICAFNWQPEDAASTQQVFGMCNNDTSGWQGSTAIDNVVTADGRSLDKTMTFVVNLARFSKLGRWEAYVGCDPDARGTRAGSCNQISDQAGNVDFVSFGTGIPGFSNG